MNCFLFGLARSRDPVSPSKTLTERCPRIFVPARRLSLGTVPPPSPSSEWRASCSERASVPCSWITVNTRRRSPKSHLTTSRRVITLRRMAKFAPRVKPHGYLLPSNTNVPSLAARGPPGQVFIRDFHRRSHHQDKQQWRARHPCGKASQRATSA